MGAAWLGDRNAIGGRGGKKTGRQAMLQTTHGAAIDITAKSPPNTCVCGYPETDTVMRDVLIETDIKI